jgi:hypothetical protein
LFSFTIPISIIIRSIVVFPLSYYNTFAQIILIATFLRNPKKYYLLLCYSLFAIIYLIVFNSIGARFGLIALNGIIIVVVLLDQMFNDLKEGQINLFLIILISFFILSSLRSIGMSMRTNLGVLSSNLGFAFQMIYAILFTFINVDTKTYKIKPTVNS